MNEKRTYRRKVCNKATNIITHKNVKPSTVSVSLVGHQAVHAAECFHCIIINFFPTATHIRNREPPEISHTHGNDYFTTNKSTNK